jgi:hypothetical protein
MVAWYEEDAGAHDLCTMIATDGHAMDYLAPRFSGELVAAVPSRSSVAVTGTAHPDGIAVLGRMIDAVWQEGDHLLTRELLVRRNNTWQTLPSEAWS